MLIELAKRLIDAMNNYLESFFLFTWSLIRLFVMVEAVSDLRFEPESKIRLGKKQEYFFPWLYPQNAPINMFTEEVVQTRSLATWSHVSESPLNQLPRLNAREKALAYLFAKGYGHESLLDSLPRYAMRQRREAPLCASPHLPDMLHMVKPQTCCGGTSRERGNVCIFCVLIFERD